MNLPPALLDLASQIANGELSLDEVMQHLSQAGQPDDSPENRTESVDGATIDLGREKRCGFGEVVFGQGKPASLIVEIARKQTDANQTCLVTRIDPATASEVQQSLGTQIPTRHNSVGKTLTTDATPITEPIDVTSASHKLHVALVTAGSTDAPVAEEAAETLNWMGIPYQRFDDIGVAGPQRLLAAVPRLRLASAVVVIAGMEGALPAVVGGHLSVPIFAVPSHVGYGTNLGGFTPLMGMLSCCAANVAVVNIDAGFKGAYLAGLVVRQLQMQKESLQARQSPQHVDETQS